MTREEAKRFIPILQAFAEGKIIETRRKPTADNNGVTKDGWFEFNDWTEMKELEYWVKHQPVGFMKFKDTESGYYMLTGIARGLGVGINDSLFSYDRVFDDYTFADGTPFGVKVEE